MDMEQPLSGMPVYRTRPEFIEALLLLPETADAIARWTKGTVVRMEDGTIFVVIPTTPGHIVAMQNMYVIRTARHEWNIMPINYFVGMFEKI